MVRYVVSIVIAVALVLGIVAALLIRRYAPGPPSPSAEVHAQRMAALEQLANEGYFSRVSVQERKIYVTAKWRERLEWDSKVETIKLFFIACYGNDTHKENSVEVLDQVSGPIGSYNAKDGLKLNK